jgi:hypothetical protein
MLIFALDTLRDNINIFKNYWVYELSTTKKIKQTPWPESAREYRLSAELVPTFKDRGGTTWSAWRIPTAAFSVF